MSKLNKVPTFSRRSKPSTAIRHPLDFSISSNSDNDLQNSPSNSQISNSPKYPPELNSFWKYLMSSETLKETREIFTENDSIVLALPVMNEPNSNPISAQEIENEIDNYILFTNALYNPSNDNIVKYTTSSGLFGTIERTKLSVDGVFPDERTINNLIQEHEHAINLDFPENSDRNNSNSETAKVKSLFDVLVNNIDKKSFKILHSGVAPLTSHPPTNINVIYINNRIKSSDFLLTNTNLQERRRSSQIIHRPNSISHSVTSASDRRSPTSLLSKNKSNSSIKSTLDDTIGIELHHKNDLIDSLKFRKINRLKVAFVNTLAAFSYHCTISASKVVDDPLVEKSLETLVDFSEKVNSELLNLLENSISANSPQVRATPNFSFSLSFKPSQPINSERKNLQQISRSWDSQLTKFIENIYGVMSELVHTGEDKDITIQTIVNQLGNTVEQLLFDWSYSSIDRAIQLFAEGEKNDELLSSQIASLSLLGVELHHLGLHGFNSLNILNDQLNHQDCSNEKNFSTNISPQNQYKNSLDSVISKIGSELELLSKVKNLSEKAICVQDAVNAAACAQIPNTDRTSFISQNSETESLAPPSVKTVSNTHISADQLLPILIYSLIKLNPPRLYSNFKLLQLFHAKVLLQPLESYCLVTLQAATEYLLNVNVEELMNSGNTDADKDSLINTKPSPLGLSSDLTNPELVSISDNEGSKDYSNILAGFSGIPSMISKVPIVSNVGSISYGIVSGVAGTGIRAATGVFDAIKNANASKSPSAASSDYKQQSQTSQIDDSRVPASSLRRDSDTSQVVSPLNKKVSINLTNKHHSKYKMKFAPINTEFLNLDVNELKYNQIQSLLESYKELAKFVTENL